MLVGRERRGKTTLLKHLMERGQQTENRSLFSRRHDSSRTQLTTVGISLRDWVYKRTSNIIADIKTITYRTWDFAGQVSCCHDYKQVTMDSVVNGKGTEWDFGQS